MTRAVFLDRDGVINANLERDGRPVAPTTLEEFRLIPGVRDDVSRLRAAGFLIIVVTNQPDVATGLTPLAVVQAMHNIVFRELRIDDMKVCFHTDADNCTCRKPKPGMLLEAAQAHGIDLARSYLIGDRWRDVAAGNAAGCTSIFIDYGYRQDGPNHPAKTVGSLTEAVDFILAREQSRG